MWSGLGVVGALQAACNAAWQTTGRGLLDRAVAVTWLLGAGGLFLVTLALGPVVGLVPGQLAILTIVLGAALTTLLFLWTFTFLGNQRVPWRAHLAGARTRRRLTADAGRPPLRGAGALLDVAPTGFEPALPP